MRVIIINYNRPIVNHLSILYIHAEPNNDNKEKEEKETKIDKEKKEQDQTKDKDKDADKNKKNGNKIDNSDFCLLYTSPSPRDRS